MRKVLVIAYFFPPAAGGGISRTVGLVRYLRDYGWDPIVLTVDDPDSPMRDERALADLPGGLLIERTRRPRLTGMRRLWRRRSGGGRSGRTHSIARRISDWLLLPDPYRTWVPAAVRAGRRLVQTYRPEVVLTTSPPLSSHLAGMALARSGGLGWVADFRDPWTRWMSLGAPTALHRALQRRLERTVLARANQVTAVHPGFFAAETGGFGGVEVIHIPGGFDPAVELPETKRPAGGPFRLVFTGSLTRLVAADPFLHGLKRLIETWPEGGEKIRVEFHGFRDVENERTAARLALDSVVGFHDPVSHHRALSLQAGADGLLLLLPHAPGIETCYAGKLFEYLAAARPIFAVAPRISAAAELIDRLKAGLVVDPDSPDQIAAALQGFVSGTKEFRPPSRELLEPFNLKNLAGRLAEILERAAGEASV